MKKLRIILPVMIALVLLTVLATVLSISFAKEEEKSATVPFEVVETTEYVSKPKKPKFEDLTGDFLHISTELENTFNASFVKRLTTHFNQVYPILAERWNYGIMYDVNYDMGELEGAAAYQMGTSNPLVMQICLIEGHFKANPGDVHTLTHELTHALQAYRDSKYGATNNANGGSWITEGIADVSRYNYDPGFVLYNYASNQKYTDSYRITARFFIWIEDNVQETFVEQFHEALKCEPYSAKFFVRITGYTVDELWQMYAESDHKIKS